MDMDAFDIIIVIILVCAAIRGYMKGLIAQIGSLAALVCAFLASRLLGPGVAKLAAEHWSGNPQISCALSYIAVFAAAWVAVTLTVRLVRGAVKAVHLGALDAVGGLVFCVFKWAVGMSLCINLYLAAAPDQSAQFTAPGHPVRAALAELLPACTGYIAHYIPENFKPAEE